MNRRRWLRTATSLALGLRLGHTSAAMDVGPLRPRREAPDVRLLRHDGRALTLPAQLRGGFTVVQLMFTGCSAICPMQGALFASLQGLLAAQADARDVRLLSLSIDPLGDDPKALSAWLKRFGADARWSAAAPLPQDLDRMLDGLGQRGTTTGDRHTGQLSLFDRDGRLAWRTSELPPAREVSDALRALRLRS